MYTTLHTVMPEPDLSLNISLPFIDEAKEVGSYKGLPLTREMCSSSASDSGSSTGSECATTTTLSLGLENVGFKQRLISRNLNHLHSYQPQIYGRDFKRNTSSGVKRNTRAPRMRWTTTLHAHFVHSVQLLGGHESKPFKD